MGGTVELEIPPRPDWFALVRRVVGVAASMAAALPDRRVDDLGLAVSEACANAVDGQRAAGSTLPIRVTIAIADDGVAVTITDHGGGFDPGEIDPIPSAEDPRRLRHERGLGLPLMRDLADRVTFTRTADGTAVRLEVLVIGSQQL
jgi:anti-sigma regulatory factor (Ser/Thr protein kinase)